LALQGCHALDLEAATNRELDILAFDQVDQPPPASPLASVR
jgi:hypothetical protein